MLLSEELVGKAFEIASRESRNASIRLYYLLHSDRVAKANDNYRKTHNNQHRETVRRYYARNRERIHRNKKVWYYKNHERVTKLARVYNLKRKALKESTTTNAQAIADYTRKTLNLKKAHCHWCGSIIETKDIHFDHVIPLSKGGPHTVENLCISCAQCNQSKHNKMPDQFVVNGQTHFVL